MRCHDMKVHTAPLARPPPSDSDAILVDDGEGTGQLSSMLPDASGRDASPCLIRQTVKAKQNHAVMGTSLPEHELAEVLVSGHHHCLICTCHAQHLIVRDPGFKLCHVRDVMALVRRASTIGLSTPSSQTSLKEA